jgi:hypothetical protein
MKYYQETQLFDRYEIKLRHLYECKRQVDKTCITLFRSDHIDVDKFEDIMNQMDTISVCQMQDLIIELLREIIDRGQNQDERNDVWKQIIASIFYRYEIRYELRKDLNERM